MLINIIYKNNIKYINIHYFIFNFHLLIKFLLNINISFKTILYLSFKIYFKKLLKKMRLNPENLSKKGRAFKRPTNKKMFHFFITFVHTNALLAFWERFCQGT